MIRHPLQCKTSPPTTEGFAQFLKLRPGGTIVRDALNVTLALVGPICRAEPPVGRMKELDLFRDWNVRDSFRSYHLG